MTIHEGNWRDMRALPMVIAGAVLTLIATCAPFIDRASTTVLADHIRHGYPGYSAGEVSNAVTAYLAIVAIVGVLVLAGWLGTLWSMQKGKRWSRWLATGTFVVAVCVALSALTIRDTSGDVGLAPVFGWLLILPCLPGLVAVWRMWRAAE